MGFGDTTLGGDARAFPTTQWSQVLAAQDPTQPGQREKVDALLLTYWKPAYAYIRLGWKKSNEDAKDLTQAFFARLLQNGRIGAIRTEGGRFRSYFKQALRNFLIDADRAAEVRKLVEAVPVTDVDLAAPEREFDREWLSVLLDASIARLESELKKEGKDAYFHVFRTYLLEPDAAREVPVTTRSGDFSLPTYGTVARRWGLKESDVRNYLSHCRARLREILKVGIRETVEDARDVEEELRSLLNE